MLWLGLIIIKKQGEGDEYNKLYILLFLYLLLRMEVKILKKSISNQMGVVLVEKNYEYFITKVLKSKIIEEKVKYYIIKIPNINLEKQEYNGREWYQSKDRKFGVFRDETMMFNQTKEKGWRILFQRS